MSAPAELPCPVLGSCESCGTPDDLAAVEAITPVGMLCFTLCGACVDAHNVPRLSSWTQAISRVLDHCEHTGRSVDEPSEWRGGAR
jgi:hypothetical protein